MQYLPFTNEPPDERQHFHERAHQALARAKAGGPVYDGPAYSAYLRDRVRAALNGGKTAVKKPAPITLGGTHPHESGNSALGPSTDRS